MASNDVSRGCPISNIHPTCLLARGLGSLRALEDKVVKAKAQDEKNEAVSSPPLQGSCGRVGSYGRVLAKQCHTKLKTSRERNV
jgi:hypothetical protein